MIPKKLLEGLKVDMQDVADIVAETGEAYFIGAFRRKEFDGKAWPKAKADETGKRKRGSLMVDSATLMGSVRTAEATPGHVKWSAGNDNVPYAKVHNEGGKAGRGNGFTMPKRQYMGDAGELAEKIKKRLVAYITKSK